MTFLPWFVPRTEPPLELCEIDPDRGHLLTERCGDIYMSVSRCRAGGDDCCCRCRGEAPANISLLHGRFHCSLRMQDRYQVLQERVLQQHQVLQQQLMPLLRALQQHEEVVAHSRDGSHLTESLVEQNCVSSVYSSGYVCIMDLKQLSHGIQTRKTKTEKQQ